ncbi:MULTISPECIES: SIS domain-containing protein [unclassified Peribacillus]|uniref:SIS domain-containing protein n=1 Tax=unclassified Peribacillus TaxID=2675266 RepID=UPI001F4EADD3|nr:MULTISPECIES: SIS domain-containing protein [unclassified Peribacillus]MCK1986044.1 SIS domain-containing protein [Peribacillus sp. Aquil_B1]MCK2011342.1 SIS domain-containing protein [Peribacillus sp. Aquil_B8]
MNTMMTYIDQQYEILMDITSKYNERLSRFASVIREKKAKKWLVLATGSSYNSTLSAKMYIERIAGVKIEIQEPFNFYEYEKISSDTDLILAVSQRGTSYSTIEAIKKCAKEAEVPQIVITSIMDSPIVKYAHEVIDMGCAIETVGYSTKGVSATILTLMLMGVVAGKELGKLSDEDVESELDKIKQLIELIPKTIEKSIEFYNQNKKELDQAQRFTPIGYGPNVGTVKEAETKFTETIRVPTQGFEMEAYMHGPIFELQEDYFVIFTEVVPSTVFERSNKLNHYLSKHCRNVYSISNLPQSENKKHLGLDTELDEYLSPLMLVVPYQVLSYYISLAKGIDLSNPVYSDFGEVMKSKVE